VAIVRELLKSSGIKTLTAIVGSREWGRGRGQSQIKPELAASRGAPVYDRKARSNYPGFAWARTRQTIPGNISHGGFIRVNLACFHQFFSTAIVVPPAVSVKMPSVSARLDAINNFSIID